MPILGREPFKVRRPSAVLQQDMRPTAPSARTYSAHGVQHVPGIAERWATVSRPAGFLRWDHARFWHRRFDHGSRGCDGLLRNIEFKSMRSISASILPSVHVCTPFLSDAHKRQATAASQLGHASPGATTSRHTCNKLEFDDTPACFPPKTIKLDHRFRMVVAATVKRKRAIVAT